MCMCVLDTSASFTELSLILVESGESNVTYVIDVIRSTIVSSNANLIGLTFEPTSNQPSTTQVVASQSPTTFSSQVYRYRVYIAKSLTEFSFKPVIDSTATIIATYRRVAPTAGTPVSVVVSNNALSPAISIGSEQLQLDLEVTAQDGTTDKTYVFILLGGTLSTDPVVTQTGAGSSIAPSGGWEVIIAILATAAMWNRQQW